MWSYWLQKIGVYLTIILVLILAPIITMQIIEGDIFTLSLYLAIIVGVSFILQPVGRQWIYIVCLVMVTTTINFLPINFSFFELSVLMVGAHFIIEHVMIRHRGIRFGNFFVMGCITIIGGILLYHWLRQGIGFKMLGGSEVGARKNFSAILGCISYLLIVTLGKGQWKLLNRVPLFYFLTNLFFIVPFVITSYFPSTTPYIYRILSSVNLEAYQADMLNADSLGRIGQLGVFAISLEVFLIAQYPVRHWWRPERWWVAALFFMAFLLCLRSGFRNSLFSFVMVAGVGFYLSLGFRSLWFALVLGIVVSILSIGQGTFFELPPSVQRTMSFVPGHWDAEVLVTTESSNDFRRQIQDIYIKEYFDRSPLMGNGFNYDKSALYMLNYNFGITSYGMTSYDFHKGFVLRKDFHIGWIGLYDAVGIIGGTFFILMFFMNLYLLFKSYNYFPRANLPPIILWVPVQLISAYISYFVVFGAFQQMLPWVCVLSALTYLIYEYTKEQQRIDNNLMDNEQKEKS